MSYWEAAILGIVQGLTEFLPISSSGHLVLGQAFLGIEIQDIAFEIFVHFGTLLAVITVFRDDIAFLLKSLASIPSLKTKSDNPIDFQPHKGLKLLGLIIIGTIPAGILGLLFKDSFEIAFTRLDFVCGALIATGLILLLSKFSNERGNEFSLLRALVVGLGQAAAILPGISRSGTTITTGMLFGINRIEAARFSFLMAIPLILGATVLEVSELVTHPPSGQRLLGLAIGTVTSYISGVFAIKWLLAVINQGTFDRFAYYCFTIGIIGLVLIYF